LKLKFAGVLKDNIFGVGDDDTFASIIKQMLFCKKKTISFVESCTVGIIAVAITDIPGSSLYFKSSVVAYSNESRIKLFSVKRRYFK
jgi:nicotinamide-nucleotide amidase